MTAKQTIEAGKAILGIEFGSTRIKAVLIDEDNKPIAQGSHEWENQLVDGLWTYSTEAVWYGLQDCYAEDLTLEPMYGVGGTIEATLTEDPALGDRLMICSSSLSFSGCSTGSPASSA